ncbi:serine hydrolase domain-containing protein [Mucilaginibacter flavus]|uniref:serine hydrolase domain-containing protein n=1 Tax=Mucilaginibacter flavus TaxID=931504 RepID=UPI0025B3BBA9|nr:serine hydrolase domain-containing protein [Mucilaginibacter flavus]MDN3584585.1 serine hydrolase domain-containing protein [Mucilaginibacter flavus]
MKAIIITSFCLLIGWMQAKSQSIDSFFKAKQDQHQLNGAVLLAEKGKVVFQSTGGYADFASKKLNNANSRFNLASISKTFTAVAVLQLKDKGKLKLDDHVVKYLPRFPYPEISIRQLLSHTSGLPDIEIYGYLVGLNNDMIVTNKNVMEALRKWDKGLLFKPGDNYRYSNPGYSVLALLVEKLSGTSFADYLHRNIFIPAQMTKIYLWLPTKTSVYHNPDTALVKLNVQSAWYEKDFAAIDSVGQYRYFIYNCAGTYGEKNIISTTADLLKFDQALFSGRLLKASTLQQTFTPVRLNSGQIWYAEHMDTMLGEGRGSYGLGFEIFEQPGFGKSVGHGGFMGGLATFYLHNLAKNQTVIAYQNTSGRQFGNLVTAAIYLLNHRALYQRKFKESLTRIYGHTMKTQGVDAATVVMDELRSDTGQYELKEQEMSQLGGDFL